MVDQWLGLLQIVGCSSSARDFVWLQSIGIIPKQTT